MFYLCLVMTVYGACVYILKMCVIQCVLNPWLLDCRATTSDSGGLLDESTFQSLCPEVIFVFRTQTTAWNAIFFFLLVDNEFWSVSIRTLSYLQDLLVIVFRVSWLFIASWKKVLNGLFFNNTTNQIIIHGVAQ